MDTIERKDEIDLQRAKNSLQRAEERLEKKTDIDIERAKLSKKEHKIELK